MRHSLSLLPISLSTFGGLCLQLWYLLCSGLREVDGAEFCRAQQVIAGSMSGVQEQVLLSEGPQQQTVVGKGQSSWEAQRGS